VTVPLSQPLLFIVPAHYRRRLIPVNPSASALLLAQGESNVSATAPGSQSCFVLEWVGSEPCFGHGSGNIGFRRYMQAHRHAGGAR